MVISRLFYLQIVIGSQYRTKALSQTQKLEKINTHRGTIYDNFGFPLVQNQTTYTLSIYKPNLTLPLDQIISKINSVQPDFESKFEQLISKFSQNDKQKWISFPQHFDKHQYDLLSDISGIEFSQDQKRFYPENQLAKNILGLVAQDSDGKTTGYGGLEGYYNKHLEGRPGYAWQVKDAQGKSLISLSNWETNPLDGRNLHTTINRDIQYLIEKILKEGVETYNADSGLITIMQPQTGNIIAMADYTATQSATPSATANTAITSLFEPGSIFKPLVVAMALDKNAISSDYICHLCDRPLTIGQYTIENWNQETHPESPLKDIIKNSDNIGMSLIIRQLGLKSFLQYYSLLGLSNKSGIDLQGESKPISKNIWPEIDLATASFGQGIAINQIQMLTAFNTLANEGKLVSPKIVRYLSENDQTIVSKKTPSRQVFKPTTTQTVKEILKYSVENGSIARLKPKNIEACAKSGTAQVAVKGGYTDDNTVASYVGFSPCDTPKFTMIITINRPRTTPWGASSAAPLWYDLAEKLNFIL
ncbi:MAG: Peptidoglycan glycosyltransferase [Candidatus Shapirobacteria bacterium GW2011_GWE2_38_30]|uniref:Peptidoglycan glycosyltransferase n=2 Tax=Candidatus Shapironibacteriota TaxID=1752721 RepID=A0A0G0MS82_9BACT|nr:MAG: Peptidoglycan glycosyltransferase [Candidatus Shapirobacteria bacterium GW2011_GWE2_38_30]